MLTGDTVESLRPRLERLARSHLSRLHLPIEPREEARDVVQDAFLSYLDYGYTEKEPFSLLAKIVVRNVYRLARHESRHPADRGVTFEIAAPRQQVTLTQPAMALACSLSERRLELWYLMSKGLTGEQAREAMGISDESYRVMKGRVLRATAPIETQVCEGCHQPILHSKRRHQKWHGSTCRMRAKRRAA